MLLTFQGPVAARKSHHNRTMGQFTPSMARKTPVSSHKKQGPSELVIRGQEVKRE